MRNTYEMFSSQGDAAVDGIVRHAADAFDDLGDAWQWAAHELELLSEMSTYSEADDTAVREAVYAALKEFFVLPVFKSVRA